VPTLTEDRISALLQPYLPAAPNPTLYTQLSKYLDLLLRWNARTNLTAIRDPEEIVRRHFGESLFAASHLSPVLPPTAVLLDFGSGAGFPGLPIQLLLPSLRVTLAESQGKKAAFLREAVRTLGLSTEVWAARVETMPQDRRFDAVTMRAVDKMETALSEGRTRVAAAGLLAVLGGRGLTVDLPNAQSVPVPETADSFLYLDRSRSVPRGTSSPNLTNVPRGTSHPH
jgi:16S rRNA (guanine527-N7)-methyltransferase